MADPVIAQRSPYSTTLEPGTYWWRQCGQSNQRPFCDGSHAVVIIPPTNGIAMVPISRSILNTAAPYPKMKVTV